MLKDFNFKQFRTDVIELLKPLEKVYGISITDGAVVYDDFKFTLSICGEKENPVYKQAEFISQCRQFGFEPRDFGRKVKVLGKDYIFVGFRESEDKPCLLYDINTEEVFHASEDVVEDGFERVIKNNESQLSSDDMIDLLLEM